MKLSEKNLRMSKAQREETPRSRERRSEWERERERAMRKVQHTIVQEGRQTREVRGGEVRVMHVCVRKCVCVSVRQRANDYPFSCLLHYPINGVIYAFIFPMPPPACQPHIPALTLTLPSTHTSYTFPLRYQIFIYTWAIIIHWCIERQAQARTR